MANIRQQIVCLSSVIILAFFSSGCSAVKEYKAFVQGFWAKVDHLAKADQMNEQLRARIEVLEQENVRLRHQLAQVEERGRAHEIKAEAHQESGNEQARTEHSLVPELKEKGRSIASHHKADAHHGADAHHESDKHHKGDAKNHHKADADSHHKTDTHHAAADHGHQDSEKAHNEDSEQELGIMSLPPKKIYTAALKSFENKEFDRAARGFIVLANNKQNQLYDTAEVNYLAGVSLYELKNYTKALAYLQKSLEKATAHRAASREPAALRDIKFAPKSLGWMALCQQKLGNKEKSRQLINDLINQYPHSEDAKRFRHK